MRRSGLLSLLAVLLLVLAAPAEAHLLGSGGAGLAAGFVHPLGGFDHLLAMLAVGAWAAQLGGRAGWLVPAAFVVMVAAGGSVGMGAAAGTTVETAIALTVVLLGGFILLALRPALAVGMALVGGFALFHGYAHGAELPEAAAPALYAAGFLGATALLHGLGLGFGLILPRLLGPKALRWSGAAVAVAGAAMLAGI